MQEFICPKCGHISTYDPWTEMAHCSQCGYKPPEKVRIRRRRTKKRTGAHQPFLDELISHWEGTHTPDRDFQLPTPGFALAFFQNYQRAMGEDPLGLSGDHMQYVRNYRPQKNEILSFVGGYLLLRRGDQAGAERRLHYLTLVCPQFADPWIWLTAVTDDVAEREDYLENAIIQEPGHPLARDALAILQGRVKPKPEGVWRVERLEHELTTSKCPHCGGSLQYEAGTTEVACPYCGHQIQLQQRKLIEEEATPIGDLQLKRRYRGHTWAEIQRVVHCQACGAEMTMTHRLAQRCIFCSSTNVLVKDNRLSFEQPDGFLPFGIDEKQATDAIHEAQHSGLRGIITWVTGKEREVWNLQGIYLPFWVFDGIVEVRLEATSGYTAGTSMGMPPRTDMMVFDNLLFPAFEVPPSSLLKRIFPFQLEKLVPYEPRLLADWPAQLYSRDVEVVIERAYDRMINLAHQRSASLTAAVPESSAPTTIRRSFQVSSTTYQLILLPVWVVLLQGEEEYRLGLVNGQTGKVGFGPQVVQKGD